MQKEKASYSA